MPRIKVIDKIESVGRLKEIYSQMEEQRGAIANVIKVQSLRPESIVMHMNLYMEIMFSKSQLSRAEREMMAVVVSTMNVCKYCQIHHSEALNKYWKDTERLSSFMNNFRNVELTNREYLLCDFAKTLTKQPGENEGYLIELLKTEGLTDEAILDATLVVAYFNFVNRLVIALDVEIEPEKGLGYNY